MQGCSIVPGSGDPPDNPPDDPPDDPPGDPPGRYRPWPMGCQGDERLGPGDPAGPYRTGPKRHRGDHLRPGLAADVQKRA